MSALSIFSFIGLVGLMFLVPVLCSIYKKGDIRVHFSRGKMSFELEAKERDSER